MSRPLGRAVAVATAVWLFMFGMVSIDYFATRAGSLEQAMVTAVGPTGQQTDCGPRSFLPNTDEEEVTFSVPRPARPSLPSAFSIRGCPKDVRVGDTVPVVRVGSGDKATVYIEPPESLGAVASFPLPWAAAALAGAYLYWQGSAMLSRRRGRARPEIGR